MLFHLEEFLMTITSMNPTVCAVRALAPNSSLASMSREAAQEQVRSLGGATPSSVSGEVDFLVVGDADYDKMLAGKVSSKLKKAMALREAGGRILIVPERDFLPMLAPDSPSA